MNIIVCLDDNKGLLFNNRRQSRDKIVIKNIVDNITDNIYIDDYSKELFEEYLDLDKIKQISNNIDENGYYFIEDYSLISNVDNIDNIIIYNWNRSYPSDIKFDIDLNNYNLISEEEFVGFSHEKITKQIYKRK